jgi:hypothetical protein
VFFSLTVLFASDQLLNKRKQAGKADIHTFNHVRQLDVSFTKLGHLFDVVAWGWVVTQSDDASETVKAVTDCDVNGFSKNAVSFLAVSQYLRVPA